MKRALYDCLNAKWPRDNEYIYCSKGHTLGTGAVHTRQVDREDKLIFKVCQDCPDFIDMNDEEVK